MSANAAPTDGQEPNDQTIVDVFEDHSKRGLSTGDVVAALPFERDAVYDKLIELDGEGVLDRERVPAWETLWWLADVPDGLEGGSAR